MVAHGQYGAEQRPTCDAERRPTHDVEGKWAPHVDAGRTDHHGHGKEDPAQPGTDAEPSDSRQGKGDSGMARGVGAAGGQVAQDPDVG